MVYDPTVPFWDLLTASQWRPVALQWNPPRSSGSRGAIRFLGFFFWLDLFNTLLISELNAIFHWFVMIKSISLFQVSDNALS